MRQLADGSRQLDARRAAAHDGKRHPLLPPCGVGFPLCPLEGLEDAAADLGGVLDGFQAGRQRLPFPGARVMLAGTGCQDQRVVLDARVAQPHAVVRGIEARHFALPDADVALAAQHGTQRRSDVRRRQTAGGHLIQQRLEQVKIPPIDQRDPDRYAPQRLGGVQPRKPAAYDHHVMTCPVCHEFLPARSANRALLRSAPPTCPNPVARLPAHEHRKQRLTALAPDHAPPLVETRFCLQRPRGRSPITFYAHRRTSTNTIAGLNASVLQMFYCKHEQEYAGGGATHDRLAGF